MENCFEKIDEYRVQLYTSTSPYPVTHPKFVLKVLVFLDLSLQLFQVAGHTLLHPVLQLLPTLLNFAHQFGTGPVELLGQVGFFCKFKRG